MKQVLFVDDNRSTLMTLKRYFGLERDDWAPIYLDDPLHAIDYLANGSVEILITDIHMPHLNGMQLLDLVKKRFPHIIRIAISGEEDSSHRLEQAKCVHRFIEKPMSLSELDETIQRVFSLHSLIPNQATRDLIAKLDTIPVMPKVYRKLMHEFNSDDGSLKKVADLVSEDPGLSAALLKVINSAFFGMRNTITSVKQAVMLLGMEIVKGVLFSIEMVRTFTIKEDKYFSVSQVVEHSMITANFAKTILEKEGAPRPLIDKVFLASVLHDMGKLIFAVAYPGKYRQIIEYSRKLNQPIHLIEQQILGTTHAEAGAFMLGLWGLPDEIIKTIAMHHSPQKAEGEVLQMLVAMHVADTASYQIIPEFCIGGPEKFNEEFLKSVNLLDSLPRWNAICQQRAMEIGYLDEEEEVI